MRVSQFSSRLPRTCFLRLAALAAAVPVIAFANDRPWLGGTSTDWGTNSNWTGNAPSAGDNAKFGAAFTNQPNVGTNTNVGGIWMTTGAGKNVVISGTGTLQLGGNTINGTAGLGILVDNTDAFTLTINAPVTLGGASEAWTNNSGNLLTVGGSVNLGTKTLTINGTGNTTLSGVVSNGTLTKAGTGTLTLSNTGNTFAGQLSVQAGRLSIDAINNASANGELGNSANSVILGSSGNTGTLEYTGGTASSTKKFTMAASGTGAFQVDTAATNLTVSGIIDGTGALSKTGAGTLILSGANTYSGGTNIKAGTLSLGSSGALGSSGTISFGGGTLQYSASNTTDYSSRFSTAAGQGYSVDTNGQSVTLASNLTSSAGTLTKSGTGTLTLTGTNTFTGATVINGGTLSAAGASGSALGSTSSITVNAGGTLLLSTVNQINDAATMNLNGGTLLKGAFSEGSAGAVGMGALTLTASGSKIDFNNGAVGILTFASLSASGLSLTIDNWTGNAHTQGTALTDRLIFDSDQTSNLSFFNFTGYGPGAMEFALAGGFFEIVPIPEVRTFLPGLLALLVLVIRAPIVSRQWLKLGRPRSRKN